MARFQRSNDWGFPRWRDYGGERSAAKIRLCDRHGCEAPGNCPAPKSPNSPERWYFCQDHAAEYNRNWDYFAGLSKEEAEARAQAERQASEGYRESAHHQWSGPGDGSRSRDEMHALDILGLDPDSSIDDARRAWRAMAKENHPDVAPGDAEAAKRFAAGQAAWDVLRSADDRRSWKPV